MQGPTVRKLSVRGCPGRQAPYLVADLGLYSEISFMMFLIEHMICLSSVMPTGWYQGGNPEREGVHSWEVYVTMQPTIPVTLSSPLT